MRKRFLIHLLGTFALPTVVNAGIPQSQSPDKWVRINKNWKIDTKDVEIKSGKLRFYMERNATKDEFEGQTQYVMSYVGKVRVNCDKFSALIQGKVNSGLGSYYAGNDWNTITRDHVAYDLANYFCYLSGSEGYTRESNEPDWVTQIINNVEANKIERKKKLGNINCDSPVWKNKPRCN